MATNGRTTWTVLGTTLAGFAVMLSGCADKRTVKSQSQLASPYGRAITVAVAPVLNYSGSGDLDPIKVTDIFYSELQQVDGLAVIPVNRLLAEMQREKLSAIETPQQALNLASRLGADAIVVSAITEYNPYFPPVVGLVVQLYGLDGPDDPAAKIDPATVPQPTSPGKFPTDIDPKYWPKNQVQRIYNARDKAWIRQVETFARDRGDGDSPYQWEIYLRSQEYYLRFVCYQAIQELLNKELSRIGPGLPPEPMAAAKEYN